MSKDVVISGTGLFTPTDCITNDELIDSYNCYVEQFNQQQADEIKQGNVKALKPSTAEFVEKASGIKQRYVLSKDSILDINTMAPRIPERSDDELSVQAEMAVIAAKQAMKTANKTAADFDAVIVACSNLQRPYPAVAIEVQAALGIEGFAYDLNVACSSATFGIQAATNMVKMGQTRAVLMVNPEICSAHLNFCDRNGHFIFGDACTAVVIEAAETATSNTQFLVKDCKLKTIYSNNIRNNFGFLNNTAPEGIGASDKLFMQQGRKVFKDVVPMAIEFLDQQLQDNNIPIQEIKRLWFHQANLKMDLLIACQLLGRDTTAEELPIILDKYANTSSAGCIIALHLHHDDLQAGDIGLLSSFGAGYSIGSIVLEKL
tara:strand:- start:175790 stop:176914 length:1125 start_codon:yes stop_codon:yes gene_type:complete